MKKKAKRKNLIETLREKISNAEISRYEIAKRAEISEASLSYFATGQRGLSLETASKVAEVLGLELRPIDPE